MSGEVYVGDYERFQREQLAQRLRREQELAIAFSTMVTSVLDKVAVGGDQHNVAFFLSVKPDTWRRARDMSDAIVARPHP